MFSVIQSAPLAYGAGYPDRPPVPNILVDEAGVVGPEDASAVNEVAANLLRDKKGALYVVTLSSLSARGAEDDGIERYSRKLFDRWKNGWEGYGYGMLLLIAVGDRKAQIELGADWGGLHDTAATDVIEDLMVPHFKRGRYSLGLLDGVRGMDALARGLPMPERSVPWWYWPAMGVAAAFLLWMFVNLFWKGRYGWAWFLISAICNLLYWGLQGRRSRFTRNHGLFGGAAGFW